MLFGFTLDSPIGPLCVQADGAGRLTGLRLGGPDGGRRGPDAAAGAAGRTGRALLEETAAQLGEYFDGGRTAFTVPLAPEGTPFQRAVWDELGRVAYGTTVSYGELARRAGHAGAARAVGRANACNPIAVIVPCHRVVGASGALTGYGGGLEAKRFLLDLEARARRGPAS